MKPNFVPQATLRLGVLMLVFALVVSACQGNVTTNTAADSFLPNLPDYTATDTADIQDAISKVAGAAALGTGQVQVTAAIAAANSLFSCYQKAGAIKGRAYVQKANPTYAGVVFVVNNNVLTDPATFAGCAMGGRRSAQTGGLSPCGKFYTLEKDNNKFYIGYAATDESVCAQFCASLEKCPK